MFKKNYSIAVIIGAAALLAGCEKKYEYIGTYNASLQTKANVKFINLTVGSLRNTLTLNNVLVSRTATPYLSTYPLLNSYAVVEPGNIAVLIKDTLLTTTQPATNLTVPTSANSFYSIFTYDTLNNVKAKVVSDNFTIPTDSSIMIRFANFFYTTVPVANIDVFSWRAGANIATNIPLNEVTTFAPHRFNTDTLYFRSTGTTSGELVKLFYSGLTSKRAYTFATRGRYQNTTGTVSRGVTIFTNY
jgi:hypothetical protein